MIEYTTYDNSGKIINSGACQDDLLMAQRGGNTSLSVIQQISNPFTQYIDQGEITLRPTQSTAIDKATIQANGIDAITITDAPSGATIAAINIATGDKANGPCSNPETFSTNVKGSVMLTVSCWPYLDWTTTIEAI